MTRKRKANLGVEHRLTKLEDGLRQVQENVGKIMENVSNHIPTSIEAVKADLQTLLDRKTEQEAIKRFIGNFFKVSVGMASITWVLLQVAEHFYSVKEGIARIILNS